MTKIFAVSGVVVKELYRRKDFYVLFILTALVTLLFGSVNLFKGEGVIRYIKDICLLLIWVASLVIAIGTTARQLPMEKESRTLFPLLAKPLARWELVVGKFVGCWLACGLALFCFYLFFGLISASREHAWPLLSYLQAVSLHWVLLAVVIAMTLLGSLVFTAASSNATIQFIITAAILLLGQHLNKVAIGLPEPTSSLLYGIYFIIPHLEFFDIRSLIVHNWPTIPWLTWLAAILYGAAYSAIFLVAACLIFRKKSLN